MLSHSQRNNIKDSPALQRIMSHHIKAEWRCWEQHVGDYMPCVLMSDDWPRQKL